MIPASCVAKFNRAQFHFQTLQGQRNAFYGLDSYIIRRESNDDFKENRFYVDLVSDPPYADWGLMFGDGVHNLRSALDHAVYAIGIKEGQDPPTDGKRLQFLFTEDDTKWEGDKWHIKSLSHGAQAAIKAQQPRGYADEFPLTPLGEIALCQASIGTFDMSAKSVTLRLLDHRHREHPLAHIRASITCVPRTDHLLRRSRCQLHGDGLLRA